MWHDVRLALRRMGREFGYVLAVVFALGLGIGSTTAIFSLVNAVILRPLPFRDPERLVWVSSRRLEPGNRPFSLPDFLDFRDQNRTLAGIAAFANWSANLTGDGEPERLQGLRLSANAFQLLGVGATVGRALQPDDDSPGREHVVVLSHSLWQRRFGGDVHVVGRSLTLNGASYTVVGVLAASFLFPVPDVELAVPLAPDLDPLRTVRNSTNFLRAIARLKPGMTREQAQADLSLVADRLRRLYPVGNSSKIGVNLTPLLDQLVGNYRQVLWMLLGAVGLLLLITCANLANLAAVRAAGRCREFALRAALGASRLRLVRQLATESLLLFALGGMAGLLIAAWGMHVLVALSPVSLPRTQEVSLDLHVMGFAAALTALTAVVFGLGPAWQATRVNLREVLNESSQGVSEGPRQHRLRRTLIVAEITLSMVLLAGAGLLVHSFAQLMAVHPGFESRHVLAVRLSLPRLRYGDRAAVIQYYQALRQRLESMPSVEHVGFVSVLPLSGLLAAVPFTIDGRDQGPDASPVANYRLVDRGYFRALQIPLVAGREFDDHDGSEQATVVLVSRSLAKRYWPSSSPIGARLRLDDNNQQARPAEVVGVVDDVRDAGLDAEPVPTIYVPLLQMHEDGVNAVTANQYWLLKTRTEPEAVRAAVRNVIRRLDVEVPTTHIKTMDEYLEASVALRRFSLWLLVVFAAVAQVLAAVGLYGVIAYGVTRRRQEIGIRMALGAEPGQVFRMVLAQGLRLAGLGVAIGLVTALIVTRLIRSVLFGVGPSDPAVFAVIATVQMVVALLACYVPARQATKVDPLIAMR
jgi:predicted permease